MYESEEEICESRKTSDADIFVGPAPYIFPLQAVKRDECFCIA